MNKRQKEALIKFINILLSEKAWKSYKNTPILTRPILIDFLTKEDFISIRKSQNEKIILEALSDYESAFDNDWFPDDIIGLSIPNAFLFLNEIKKILIEELPSDYDRIFRKRYDGFIE